MTPSAPLGTEAAAASQAPAPLRRLPRSRKLPSRLRSPSPTPLLAHRRDATGTVASTSGTARSRRSATPTSDAARDISPLTAAPPSVAPAPTCGGAAGPALPACEPTLGSSEDALGLGKRHRRPSSKYTAPAALTDDTRRVAPPHASTPSSSTSRSRSSKARSKSPTVVVKKEEPDSCMRTPCRVTLRLPPRSVPSCISAPGALGATCLPGAAEELRTPATFTRRGERMSEPCRRTSHRGPAAWPPGPPSPQGARWRGLAPMRGARVARGALLRAGTGDASDDDSDLDDDESVDDVDAGDAEVARSAVTVSLAAKAWRLAMARSPLPGTDKTLGRDKAASLADSDMDDEPDFHQAMLRDDELDWLTPPDSSRGSDAESAVWTDGHVTTPASSGAKDSPLELSSALSPALGRASPPAEDGGAKDAVFAHALPVPHTTVPRPSTHAGALTLSLPLDVAAPELPIASASDALAAPRSAAAVPASLSEPTLPQGLYAPAPGLRTHSDVPLVPVHACSSLGHAAPDPAPEAAPLPMLVASTLPPSLASPRSPLLPAAEAAPGSLMGSDLDGTAASPDAPLLPPVFELRTEAADTDEALALSPRSAMTPPLDDVDLDAWPGAPDKLMAWTDVERMWTSGARDASAPGAAAEERRQAPPHRSVPHAAAPGTAPPAKRPRVSDSTCARQPRTRSRWRGRAA